MSKKDRRGRSCKDASLKLERSVTNYRWTIEWIPLGEENRKAVEKMARRIEFREAPEIKKKLLEDC